MNSELMTKFFDTLAERNRVLKNKMSGKPLPWTNDRCFDTYKFCNVYRDADRCSQYFIKNFLKPEFSITDLVWFGGIWHKTLTPDSCEFFKREGIYKYGLPTYDEYNEEEFKKQNEHYAAVTGKTPFHAICLTGPRGRYGLITLMHEHTPCTVANINAGVPAEHLIKAMHAEPELKFYTYEWFLNIREAYRMGLIKSSPQTFDVSAVPFVGPGTIPALQLIFPELGDIDIKKAMLPSNNVKFYKAALEIYKVAPEYMKKYDGEQIFWDFITNTWSDTYNLDFHNIEFWLCEFRKYLTIIGEVKGDPNRDKYDFNKLSRGLFG